MIGVSPLYQQAGYPTNSKNWQRINALVAREANFCQTAAFGLLLILGWLQPGKKWV